MPSEGNRPKHPLTGAVIGNYLVGEPLGTGSMGIVFAARHRFLDESVAIKVLHSVYSFDHNISRRFLLEAKSTREIDHPNVVRIFDFGQSDGGDLYLVMEQLEGTTLLEKLRAGPIEESRAAEWAMQMAAGLSSAHEKGIVHRDLKPANIYISGDRVVVLDFGLAKLLSSSAQTAPEAVIGTARYIAPEQAAGSELTGTQSDVYAIGVILFEMVTGEPPFAGEDSAALLLAHLHKAPPHPSSFRPVSRALEDIILSCLEKKPARRPPSMKALAELLAPLAKPEHSTAAERVRPAFGRTWMAWTLVAVVTVFAVSGLAWKSHVKKYLIAATENRAIAPIPKATEPLPAPAPMQGPSVTTDESEVMIRSNPSGASLIVHGAEVGSTPIKLRLRLPNKITIAHAGYRTEEKQVDSPADLEIILTKIREPAHPSFKTKPTTKPTIPPDSELD